MTGSVWSWIQQNLVDIIQSFGIIMTLLFTARQIMFANRYNRFSASMIITQSHKELWSQTLSNPNLKRIDSEDADLFKEPVTDEERIFGVMLIVHMNLVYRANKEGLFDLSHGYKQDMRELLLLPIPNKVWREIGGYYEKGFIKFIDNVLSEKRTPVDVSTFSNLLTNLNSARKINFYRGRENREENSHESGVNFLK